MSVHEGHRNRLRQRFVEHGLDTFSQHEVLELLLYYCIPRKDTNELAHKLIRRFGSVGQVFEASSRELAEVEGMGQNAAAFFDLLRATYRYIQINKNDKKKQMLSVADYGEHLENFFLGSFKEEVYLLCLDAKSCVIGCYKISEGGVNSTNVSIRKIVDMAIKSNAVSVVLAHNHPGGLALPSPDDVRTTYTIAQALLAVDVLLVDHVVIAESDYVSMRQSGIYDSSVVSLGV